MQYTHYLAACVNKVNLCVKYYTLTENRNTEFQAWARSYV